MSEIAELVALCRQRSKEGSTPQRKSYWSREANSLERDPTRGPMVRRLLQPDPRLANISPIETSHMKDPA